MLDVIIILLSTIFTAICFYKFSVTNLYSLFSVLYGIFYLFPAIDRIYGWNLVEFQLFGYYYGTSTDMKFTLIFNILVTIFFGIGYNSIFKRKNSFLITTEDRYIHQRIYLLTILILLSVIWLFRNSWQGELYQLFLPSRKKGLITSGYIKLYAFITPAILAFIAARVKLKARYFVYLIGLFIIFISGQRRFIINYIILITIGENLNRAINLKKYIRYGFIFIALVPGLWYARAIFSQLQRGKSFEDINITRSIGYLIFGSPSSGFESMLFYDKFRDFLSLDYLISLKYLIFSAVPRNLMQGKPETISSLVKTKFNWEGNPSIFFTNEMIINFRLTAPIFALIMGAFLAKIANRNSFMSIFFLAGVLTLFKGGFSYYLTEVVFTILLYSIISKLLKLKIV